MYEKSCLISQCAQGQIVPTKKVVTALRQSLAIICNPILLTRQSKTGNANIIGEKMRKAFGASFRT
jgi:hypothetical protein